jgi:hypothetical protein
MDDSTDLDRLYEELTLNRDIEEPCMPQFNCFTHYSPRWWNYWGAAYTVPKQWNPKNKRTIIYRDHEGRMHKASGPAYINPLYDEEIWYYEGKMHRDDGPAYRHKGNFAWFKHGVLHNLEGPAVVEMAGPLQYWIDGIRYSRKQYKWEIERRKRKGTMKKPRKQAASTKS